MLHFIYFDLFFVVNDVSMPDAAFDKDKARNVIVEPISPIDPKSTVL